mgnify:CR=1 FL=1
MRGTQSDGGDVLLLDGIIPAYAGNTARWKDMSVRLRDHPRVCGEHVSLNSFGIGKPGSSPRMRGTPVASDLHKTDTGIIPAYAGNTGLVHGWNARCRDHPRVCGEHDVYSAEERMKAGSSPRMRGTPNAQTATSAYTGIIPAYAGNTESVCEALVANWDHPRVCGEH